MNDIEDRLSQATTETQRQIATMDHPSQVSIGRRRRGQRIMSGIGAFALVLAAFGATAVLVSGDPNPGSFGDSTSDTAAPNTPIAQAPTTTIAPYEPGVGIEALEHLGVTLDGWTPVLAMAGDQGVSVFYNDGESIGGGEDGARISIWIWNDAPGQEPNSGYEHAFETLLQAAPEPETLPSDTVTLATGEEAHAFTFRDPDTRSGGFAFVWQLSPTQTVEVLTYVNSFDEATAIVQSIEPLSDFEWNAILDDVGEPYRETTASTTTTIAPPG